MNEYAIEFLDEEGRWIRLAAFRQPLDADRAYELMLALNPVRPIRQVLIITLSDSREGR